MQHDDKVIKNCDQVTTWIKDGVQDVVKQQHAEIIVQELDLKGVEAVGTLCAKDACEVEYYDLTKTVVNSIWQCISVNEKLDACDTLKHKNVGYSNKLKLED